MRQAVIRHSSLGIVELRTEQAPAEPRNHATSPEERKRWAAPPQPPCGRADRVEHGPHLERGLVGGGDEHHVPAHHVADRTGEVRVVRAAEQQRVDLGLAHRRQQPLGEHVHLVACRLAPLDELDEAGARGAGERRPGRSVAVHGSLVRARGDRADRADDADAAVRVAATSARTPGSMTPTTGTGSARCSASRAAAAAVLHATTTSFTS